MKRENRPNAYWCQFVLEFTEFGRVVFLSGGLRRHRVAPDGISWQLPHEYEELADSALGLAPSLFLITNFFAGHLILKDGCSPVQGYVDAMRMWARYKKNLSHEGSAMNAFQFGRLRVDANDVRSKADVLRYLAMSVGDRPVGVL